MRAFLAAVAQAVRRREIRVHAYCIMTTHYHLLIESAGELSASMARIQRDYVRWFNRGRERDGSLVRGRFKSKRVLDGDYLQCLIAYIDNNPVAARLVEWPWEYPFGSCTRLVSGSIPPWLDCGPIAYLLTERETWCEESARLYRVERTERNPAVEELMERGLRMPGYLDPWTIVGNTTPAGILEWMRRRARIADGVEIGTPLALPADVRACLAKRRIERPRTIAPKKTALRDAWQLIEISLLRDATASSWPEIATMLEVSTSVAFGRYQEHRLVIESDAAYRQEIETALAEILACYRRSSGRLTIPPGKSNPETRENVRGTATRNRE